MSRTSVLLILLIINGSFLMVVQNDPVAMGSQFSRPIDDDMRVLGSNDLRINSDTELGSLANTHGWEGNGSINNPYIIEDWNTETTAWGSGIYIANTSSHIILQNCDVSNKSKWGSYGSGSGIYLYNASNIEIQNSISVSNRYSFFIDHCRNITLKECNMSSSYQPIQFRYSNGLIVDSCWTDISWGLLAGYYSENITFRSTESRNTKGTALMSSMCENIRFEGCIIINDGSQYFSMDYRSKNWIWKSNEIHGTIISSTATSDVVFVNNTLTESILTMDFNNRVEVYNNEFEKGGIYFVPGRRFNGYTQVVPQNNTINGKPIMVVSDTDLNGSRISADPGQLVIINSTHLYASNLSFHNVSYPVSVHFCEHVRIENMTLTDVEIGIIASKVRFGMINNNTIVRTISAGIGLHHLNRDFKVSDNFMVEGSIGIKTISSSEIELSKNIAEDHRDAGILLSDHCWNNELKENILEGNVAGLRISNSGTSFNKIMENNIRFNEKGIWVHEEANGNLITNNNISQNIQYGIHLDSTTSRNDLRNNEFWINGIYGVLISGSVKNTFTNNHFMGTGLFIDMETSSQSTMTPDNTINGDPIIFIGDTNYGDNAVPENGGQYILEFVEDAIIRKLDLETSHVPIILIASSSCWVTQCNISGSKGAGLIMKNTRACRIVGNLFCMNEIGIEIFGDATSGVQSNRIEFNRFEENLDSGLKANIFMGNKIRYNIFENNLGSSINLTQCEANQIKENIIQNSGEDGIQMFSCRYNDIIGNVVTDCDRGFGLIYSGSNRIFENLVQENDGMGVEIDFNCNWNQVYDNAFIRNNGTTSIYDRDQPQAIDRGWLNNWNNSMGRGNYWSDKLSPDDDNNGIVDTSYYLGYMENNDSAPVTEIPFDLISSPRNLEIVSGDDYVELSWAIPKENIAEEIQGYNIYRNTKQEGEVLVATIQGDDIFVFNDTSMENNMIHRYSVSAMNIYGEGARSEWVIAYPDGEAPVIEVFNVSDGCAIPTRELTIEWICYDNTSGLKSLKTKFGEDGEWFDSPQNGTEEYPYLSIGMHSFFIHAVDIVENSNMIRIDFIVDLDDPQLQVLGPENNSIFNKDGFKFTWAASDTGSSIDHILINIDNGTDLEYFGSGQHEFSGLTEGPHFIQIEAFDLAGNSVQSSINIYIDMTPPVIEIPPISDGNRVNSEELLLTWSAMDPLSGISSVEFRLDEGEWEIGHWKQPLHVKGLYTGNRTLTVRVTDRAGNTALKSIYLLVDLDMPTLTERYPEGTGVPVDVGIWVKFSEEMDLGSLEILLDSREILSAWTGDRLETSGDLGLEYGSDHTVTIMGTDLAGNEIEDRSWDFSTVQGCCISGYVRSPDGSPIGNAKIMIGDQGPYYTAFDGSFEINARPGSFEMTIEAEGYEKLVHQIDMEPGGDDYIGTLTLKEVSSGSKGGGISMILVASIGSVIIITAIVIGFLLIKRSRSEKMKEAVQEVQPEERDIFERVEESREIAKRVGIHIEVYETEYERAMELKRLGEEEMSRLAVEPYLTRLESIFKELEGLDPESGSEPPVQTDTSDEIDGEGAPALEEPE